MARKFLQLQVGQDDFDNAYVDKRKSGLHLAKRVQIFVEYLTYRALNSKRIFLLY